VAGVGVLALAIIAAFVPRDAAAPEKMDWRADVAAMGRRSVLLGLATTVLGYGGVFAVFTYIAPLLTQITGFDKSAVPPILLVFGGGLVAGNILGGKLADRRLEATVLGSLLALAAVLAGMSFALHSHALAVVFVGLLGVAAFATVAPLQMWVLSKADSAGETLASSFNIAAFNLGNALGAWVGGVVIASGPGLPAVTWVAMVLPLAAVAIAFFAMRAQRGAPRVRARMSA
jgi:MFS transporter, DHA1 family, inner membrane transport protein